jgi:hypothetical protein
MELEDETEETTKVQALRSLMIAALEKQGVLPDLRATIRASIFCSLHEQEAKEMVAPPPEGLKRLRETEHAPLTTALVREFLKKTGMERTLSVFDHEISTGAAHADGHDNALLLPHTLDAPSVVDGLEVLRTSAKLGVLAPSDLQQEPKDLPLLSGLVHLLNTPAMALLPPNPVDRASLPLSPGTPRPHSPEDSSLLVSPAAAGAFFAQAAQDGFDDADDSTTTQQPQQQQVALPIMMREAEAATNDNSTSLEHEHEKPDGDTVSGGGSGGENDDPSLEEHPAKASKRGSVVLDGQVLTRSPQMKTKEAEYEETRRNSSDDRDPADKEMRYSSSSINSEEVLDNTGTSSRSAAAGSEGLLPLPAGTTGGDYFGEGTAGPPQPPPSGAATEEATNTGDDASSSAPAARPLSRSAMKRQQQQQQQQQAEVALPPSASSAPSPVPTQARPPAGPVPCGNFRLDLTAERFNTCKCGFSKAECQRSSANNNATPASTSPSQAILRSASERPNSSSSSSSSSSSASSWSCSVCKRSNDASASACGVCFTARSYQRSRSPSPSR